MASTNPATDLLADTISCGVSLAQRSKVGSAVDCGSILAYNAADIAQVAKRAADIGDAANELHKSTKIAQQANTLNDLKTLNKTTNTAGGLGDDVVLVRGGTNTPDRFTGGSGVSSDASGNLQGVSVNSGSSVEAAAQGIPNKQIGVSTVGQVRDAGGKVVRAPTPGTVTPDTA